MGTNFRYMIVILMSFFWHLSAYCQTIVFPKANIPPKILKENPNQFGRKKKKFRKKLVPREKPQKSLKERLETEANKPRPFRYLIESKLFIPSFIATDPYADFTPDISGGVESYWRISGEKTDSSALWLGFRLASINGLGTYKGYPGWFSFNYYGPALYWLHIDTGKFNSSSKGRNYSSTKYGFRAGFSGIFRQIKLPTNETNPPKNFSNTKGGDVDYPGLWFEADFGKVYYGAIGYQFHLGVQVGAQLSAAYAGVSILGLY